MDRSFIRNINPISSVLFEPVEIFLCVCVVVITCVEKVLWGDLVDEGNKESRR